jgi:predicted nuclease of predicted toxin-antitoxin system
MSKAADNEILASIMTLDADFHATLAVSGASGPFVIRLRMQGLGAPETVELVQRVLNAFKAELERGSLVTVKVRKTTCHRLPIGSSD